MAINYPCQRKAYFYLYCNYTQQNATIWVWNKGEVYYSYLFIYWAGNLLDNLVSLFDVFFTLLHSIDFSKYQLSAQFF